MAVSYTVGDLVRVQGTLSDAAGVAIDPTSLLIKVRDPSGGQFALDERIEHGSPLLLALSFDGLPPTDHQVLGRAVHLGHDDLHVLADQRGDVLDSPGVHMGGGQKRAGAADVDVQPALVHARDHAFQAVSGLDRLPEEHLVGVALAEHDCVAGRVVLLDDD